MAFERFCTGRSKAKVFTRTRSDPNKLPSCASFKPRYWPTAGRKQLKHAAVVARIGTKAEKNMDATASARLLEAVVRAVELESNFGTKQPLRVIEEQREKGLTDFNDLALESPRLAKHQLEEAVWRARQRDDEQTKEIKKGLVRLDSRAGRREIPCEILKETPHRFLVRLGEDCVLPRGREATKGQEVYVPKDAVERIAEPSLEATIEERV
jgi:hypothetical protein